MKKYRQFRRWVQPYLPFVWLILFLQQMVYIAFGRASNWAWLTAACAFYNFYDDTHPSFQPGEKLAKKVKARLERHD